MNFYEVWWYQYSQKLGGEAVGVGFVLVWSAIVIGAIVAG